MVSTSVSIGWLQKQWSVTLNFPTEKSPCNAACRQNSLTICLILKLLLLLLQLFNGFFRDNLGKPAPERQTILNFTVARDDEVVVASAGPYANHLHLVRDR